MSCRPELISEQDMSTHSGPWSIVQVCMQSVYVVYKAGFVQTETQP